MYARWACVAGLRLKSLAGTVAHVWDRILEAMRAGWRYYWAVEGTVLWELAG